MPGSGPAGLRRRAISGYAELCGAVGRAAATRPVATVALAALGCLLVAGLGYTQFYSAETSVLSQWGVRGESMMNNRGRYNHAYGEPRVAMAMLTGDNIVDNLETLYDLEAAVRETRTDSGITFDDVCFRVFEGGPCIVLSALDYYGLPFGPALRAAVIADPAPERTLSRANALNAYGQPILRDLVLGWDGVGPRPLNTSQVATAVQTMFPVNGSLLQKTEASEWELAFGNTVERFAGGGRFASFRFSDEATEEEIRATSFPDTVALLVALILALTFVCLTLGHKKISSLEMRLWPAVAAWLCVLLAAAAAIGLSLMAGVPYGFLTGTIAFFILGIGIDDAFVVLAAFSEVEAEARASSAPRSIPEMVSSTMIRAGPSVTLTTLTDIVAVLTGLATPFESVQQWSVTNALALICVWVLMMTLLPAALALDVARERALRRVCHARSSTTDNGPTQRPDQADHIVQHEPARDCEKAGDMEVIHGEGHGGGDHVNRRGTDVHAQNGADKPRWWTALVSLFFSDTGVAVIAIAAIALLSVGVIGLGQIPTSFELDIYFPDNSYLSKFLDADAQHFGGMLNTYDVIFVSIDFRSAGATSQALALNSAAVAAQPSATLIGSTPRFWLSDFEVWRGTANATAQCGVALSPTMTPVEYGGCVSRFLQTPAGQGYWSDIKFDSAGAVTQSRFTYWCAPFTDSNGVERIRRELFDLADAHRPEGAGENDVYVYSYWFATAELALTLETTLVHGVAWAGAAIALVCLLVLPLDAAVAVVVCLAAVLVEGVGLVAMLWRVSITPAAVATYLLCVGFASDSAAHMAWALVDERTHGPARAQSGPAVAERVLELALHLGPLAASEKVVHEYGRAMLYGGLSTIVVVGCLGFSPFGTFRALAIIVCTVVSLAVFHGVLVVPILYGGVVACCSTQPDGRNIENAVALSPIRFTSSDARPLGFAAHIVEETTL